MHNNQYRSSFVFALVRPILCVVILCAVFYMAKILAHRFHMLTALRILTGIK